MLKPGNVVTDLDPNSVFEGEQGEVLSVQMCIWDPPEVLVRFDEDLRRKLFIWDRESYKEGILETYTERELRHDPDWTPERYANRHFPRQWHHVQMLTRPLNQTDLCMVDGCTHHQAQIAWINIWGTVLNAFVCTEHARYYRRWSYMDSFPWRKESKGTSAA